MVTPAYVVAAWARSLGSLQPLPPNAQRPTFARAPPGLEDPACWRVPQEVVASPYINSVTPLTGATQALPPQQGKRSRRRRYQRERRRLAMVPSDGLQEAESVTSE